MIVCTSCKFYPTCGLTREGHTVNACASYKPDKQQEAKADKGKLRISLTPTQIIKDIAEVRMYGTDKYGSPENWKQVEMQRYVDALLRHTLEFIKDNDSADKESGIPHYKHMACNMAFICEMLGEK